MKNKKFSIRNKERKKIIRSIAEGIILIFLLVLILKAFLPSTHYIPVEDGQRTQVEKGFIAVSYFGVDRTGSETLISTERLEQHLKALKESGYVTITQQDILDYYQEGKPLPDKALFLIFEDGRRDTAIFAQKIMENYNMKGTIFTYAQNLEREDPKFLKENDLEALEKSSFWEFGTNGYRLEFINVFDRYNNYLGQLDTYEFQMVSSYLDRNYNHYLMDYIRDAYGIPIETLEEMQERISKDYEALESVYIDKLGAVPQMYSLMHANTGQFGTNQLVSEENEKWITKLFEMNFNREGYAKNTYTSSIYDLTRIQPQPYWSTNHLLMRIWDDTEEPVNFVTGDLERKRDWETLYGAAEFVKDTIILTSLPSDRGLMKLKNSESYKNLVISAELEGNVVGGQTIYFRADEGLNNFVALQLKDNILTVMEKIEGTEKILYTLDLDVFDGRKHQTVKENALEAEIQALEMQLRYADDLQEANKINAQLNEKRQQLDSESDNEGTEDLYIPKLTLSEADQRRIKIEVNEALLNVYLDGKLVAKDLLLTEVRTGAIYLEATYSDIGYSQRNLTDDVYDGRFKNIMVYEGDNEGELSLVYDNQLSGVEKWMDTLDTRWNQIINWFIKYL